MNEQIPQVVSGQSEWRPGCTAPQDGTTIVAVGRIIWTNGFSTSIDTFVNAIRWDRDRVGVDARTWRIAHTSMELRKKVDDRVCVDWWMPMPMMNFPDCGYPVDLPKQGPAVTSTPVGQADPARSATDVHDRAVAGRKPGQGERRPAAAH